MPCAVVTGTSSGLGRGVAERLVGLGWDVLGTVRGPTKGRGISFETVTVDVTDAVAVDELGRHVRESWGRDPSRGLMLRHELLSVSTLQATSVDTL